MTLPFVWDEHEQPYDYARYSSFGLAHLLQKNDFEIVEHRKINNGFEIIFQLINIYIYKKVYTKNKFLRLGVVIGLCSIFNILGILSSKILPRNNDLYLDNLVIVRKKQ